MNRAKPVGATDRASVRNLLPIAILGGGLVAAPAAALELGELTVHSHLGQPLRASIAFALAADETLTDSCVTVGATRASGGLPGVGKTTVSISEGTIRLAGHALIREPMLGTRVTIDCPYTPNLSREYMLFVDPQPLADRRARQAAAAAAPVARPEPQPAARPARPHRPAAAPIAPAARYQVQPGDSLSSIVLRIENRSMGLWPAVNRVFAANPDAFLDQDPNKLKSGSWLTIPSLGGTVPVVTAAATAPAVHPDAGPAPGHRAVATPADTVVAYDPAVTGKVATPPADRPVVPAGSPDTMPVAGTASESTQAASPPRVRTMIVSTGARGESTSLLTWLVGAGLAIVAVLALTGRRARRLFGAAPARPIAARPARRATDVAALAGCCDIDDDSPTEENLALDARLSAADRNEMEIAQEFSFAGTADLDIELPFEPEAAAIIDETDIIPPMRENMASILDSEILPEDDEYDMSVVLDATRMPQHDDVTEHDLMAVEVTVNDESPGDDYTISRDVDFDILEQDYEDELTASQALNQEIDRAAAEIAKHAGEPAPETPRALVAGRG